MNRTEAATRTRRRILALLCGAPRTARELAGELGITRNAARVHLTELEQEGLVRHEREIRGVGKPAHRYRLAPAGQAMVSRAYLPLLSALLATLATRLDADALELLLREAGRRLAAAQGRAEGDATARVGAAIELIEALGGSAATAATADGVMLEGACCPVAALAPEHPQVCAALAELLGAYTGLAVHERCDRAAVARCRFAIGPLA